MRLRALSPRSLPLLFVLPFVLGGCTMLADWFCWDVRVEIHRDGSSREEWRIPRAQVSVVLLSKDDVVADTVPVFADKGELERWITDRSFGQLPRLAAEGRVIDAEIELGGSAGLQATLRLSRGDLEMNDGATIVVVANFATGDNVEQHRLEIPLNDTCRLGVKLHASGVLEDVTKQINKD